MKEVAKSQKLMVYTTFSEIPLDIEGSNISNVGWIPSESDRKYMDEKDYLLAIEEGEATNGKVLFKNVTLKWDSCDCGDGYGCSHGSYVYEIEIKSKDKSHILDLEEDFITFDNNGNYGCLPIKNSTIYDFMRMCELCEIDLEFSDYALSLLS